MIRHPPRSPLFPSPTLSRSAVIHPAGPDDHGCHKTLGTGVLCAARSRASRQEPAMSQSGRMDSATEGFVAHRNLRSEEHTSELQSQSNLVCRLLLEKKKTNP